MASAFPVVYMRDVHMIEAWITYMSMHVAPEDMLDVFDALEDAFALCRRYDRGLEPIPGTQIRYRFHFGMIRCVL